MTDPTVPDRKTKRADELERNDWFRPDFTDFASAARVRHAEPYPSDSWGNGVVLLYRAVGEQGAETHRLAADTQIVMLTEDEVEQAMDVDRRERIAAQLADVIRLVRNPDFPLPAVWQPVAVDFKYADPAAVARCAAVMGVEQQKAPGQVYARRDGADDWSAGVDVCVLAFQPGPGEPKPGTTCEELSDPDPDPTGMLHTGGVVDGGQLVDETPGLVPAPIARHYDTSDGTSMDCACGAVFGVPALLQLHIAAGNAADTVPIPAEDATLTRLPGSAR